MFDQISTPRNPGSLPLTDQPYLARRQNWTNQLSRHALMVPDATALSYLGRTTTWAELDRRVTALAGALRRRGVHFGDRVLILMLNRTEFIESFLAVNKLGAVAVPVNFRMTPPEIAFLVGDCDAKVMIAEAVLAKVATAVRVLEPKLETVIIAGGVTDDGLLDYDDLLAEVGELATAVDIPNDSPALIMYTSGTTGRPKGAVLTHANLAGQAMTFLFINGADINKRRRVHRCPAVPHRGHRQHDHRAAARGTDRRVPARRFRSRRAARRARGREGHRCFPGSCAVAGGLRGTEGQSAQAETACAVVGRSARI